MPITLLLWTAGIVVALFVIPWLIGIRYIPHNKVGIVEKFWSHRGSLTEGRIVALNGEAGFQAELLRGGLHAGFFPWQYRIHKEPLVFGRTERLRHQVSGRARQAWRMPLLH